MPVDQDLTGLGFVEARNQLDQAGLAAAGSADDRGDGAGAGDETDIAQRGSDLARVARGHLPELDEALRAIQWAGAGIDLIGRIQHREQALGRSHAALGHVLHVGELLERRNDGDHRHHQRHEAAGGQAPLHGLVAGHDQQQRKAYRSHHLDQRRGNATRGLDFHRQAQVVVGQRAIARHLAGLSAIDLHFLLAAQGLIRGLQQLRAAFLDAMADLPVTPRDLVHDPGQRGSQQQDCQRHLPAVVEHHRQHRQDLEGLLQHHLGGIHGRLRNLVAVRAEPDQHRGDRFAVKTHARQAQILAQHRHSHVAGDAARGLAHAHVGQEARQATEQEQTDDGERQRQIHPGIAGDECTVHHRLHQITEGTAGGRLDQHAQQRQQQQCPVGLGQTNQPTIGLPGGSRLRTHRFTSGAVAIWIVRKPDCANAS